MAAGFAFIALNEKGLSSRNEPDTVIEGFENRQSTIERAANGTEDGKVGSSSVRIPLIITDPSAFPAGI